MVAEKTHVLTFRTSSGDFIVETDDLEDVARQEWFKEFLNIRGMEQEQEVEQVQPVKAVMPTRSMPSMPQMTRPTMPSFLDVPPEQMNMDRWNSWSEEQRQQWLKKYSGQV